MKNYYRIILGRQHVHAEEAFKGNFIGGDFDIDQDLTNHLSENYRDFNREFIPIYLQKHPDKTRVRAGLACGNLWTISKGLQVGDVVLCPDGQRNYYVGEVMSHYEYQKDQNLPHRRRVNWLPKLLPRDEMGYSLKHAAGAIGTVSDISRYGDEIEALISGNRQPSIVATDSTIEDPINFALEEHLEEFLIQNWRSTEFGQRYDIYEEDGENGQQYRTDDNGRIDILAISRDKKELLVIELKKGRTNDVVIGQILRYMGYVKNELAEANQTVRGIIIALEDDARIHRALSVVQNIDFYTYKVQFKLEKK